MLNKIINLSRFRKQFVLLFIDSILVVSVLFLSFSIRLGYWYFPDSNMIWLIFGAPILGIPIFMRFGLYRAIIRYIGFKALWAVIQATTLYALLWSLIGIMAAIEVIPRSVILINWLLTISAIGGFRMVGRWLLTSIENKSNNINCSNVVIYGAGAAGRQLSTALRQSIEYNPVAFIDDNSEMHRQSIDGIGIISRNNLESLIEKENVKEVLLAIPSLSRIQRNEIISFLEPYSVLFRSLPGVSELAQGKVKIADLRDVSVKDILGRDSVAPNKELLSLNITNKVVMVTGAGGSIGSELCRQILFLKPKVLILFERSEYHLYTINNELLGFGMSDIKILPMLGSVKDRNRLNHIMNKFNIHTIYHAAAYKHVPMVEFNNTEGVSNNIFGTLNCAQIANDNEVENFVLISTDKAVRPTNTMGATKRFAEIILQALTQQNRILEEQNSHSSNEKDLIKPLGTCFSMVRFGNVLNSSGSVIPLFKEQIKNGGPVTVTDINITRYFMSIPEAVQLVIQAGSMAKGGDVYVLDMGEPVRIVDLAKKMISLSGLRVKDETQTNGNIEIEFTGLRPGEKLYEELLIGDNVFKTENSMIMRAEEEMIAWDDLKLIIDDLENAINRCDQKLIRQLLIKAVPGFKPESKINDILYDDY